MLSQPIIIIRTEVVKSWPVCGEDQSSLAGSWILSSTLERHLNSLNAMFVIDNTGNPIFFP